MFLIKEASLYIIYEILFYEGLRLIKYYEIVSPVREFFMCL